MKDVMVAEERRLEKLTSELQEASKAYYNENRELMSNKEYDQKYDELAALEKSLAYIFLPVRRTLSATRLSHTLRKSPTKYLHCL